MQVSLTTMHFCQQARQPLRVKTPVRPIGLLPDIKFISAIHAAIMNDILRKVKLIALYLAMIGMRGKPRPSDLVAKQPLGEAAELGRGRIARTPLASFVG